MNKKTLEEINERAGAELLEAKDKINRLRYELRELSKIDDEQRAMLTELRKELKECRKQLEASYQYKHIQHLKAELLDAGDEIAELKETVRKQDDVYDAVMGDLQEKEETIRRLQETIVHLDLLNRIDARLDRIERLQEDIYDTL